MATSSIVGGSRLPEDISGKDLHALGPSDNSDSGSDAVGAYGEDELSSDSDAVGTGERASVGAGREHLDADILPDHIERAPGVGEDIDLGDLSGDEQGDLEGVGDMTVDGDDLEAGSGEDDAEKVP